jgi:hypothetical protein
MQEKTGAVVLLASTENTRYAKLLERFQKETEALDP